MQLSVRTSGSVVETTYVQFSVETLFVSGLQIPGHGFLVLNCGSEDTLATENSSIFNSTPSTRSKKSLADSWEMALVR